MKYLILILAMVTFTFAAEQPPVGDKPAEQPKTVVKLTPSANKAIAQFEADQAKAKADYDKKVADLKKVAAAAMDKEILAATKDGNLDLAIALRTKKEEYAVAVVKKEEVKKEEVSFNGLWDWGVGKTVTIDKSAVMRRNNGQQVKGTVVINKNVMTISWENNIIHTVTYENNIFICKTSEAEIYEVMKK